MADLKPIGSEKLQGMEKIARIMEIARYGETPKEEVNINETLSFTKKLADGFVYGIVKEKNGYVLKKGINESSLDYMDQLQNRKYFNSYSQALKRFNLLTGEINRLTENETEISLFGEQKKFVLKSPKMKSSPEVSAPPADLSAPAPEVSAPPADLSTPAPEVSAPPADDMGVEPTDDMGVEPTDDMGVEPTDDTEEVTFKTIQKLTGKLGQKLRTFEEDNDMSAEDVKYVLNSILSALDLTILEDSDVEEIIAKIEGTEEDSDMSGPAMGASDEEEPQLDITPETGDEITTPEVGESYSEVSEMIGGMFESKVDKILSKYFVITEEEKEKNIQKFIRKKINKVGVVDEIKRLSESIEQELTAEFILSENQNVKFVGKTNLKNLVFENEGKQIKVSPRGVIL